MKKLILCFSFSILSLIGKSISPHPENISNVTQSLFNTSTITVNVENDLSCILNLELYFYQSDGEIFLNKFVVPISNEGVGTLAGVPENVYDIYVYSPRFLMKKITSFEVLGSEQELTISNLRIGDANNDNSINIVDVSLLSSIFGSSEVNDMFVANYDFNCDGSINIGDFSVFASNFGQTGEVAPEVNPNASEDPVEVHSNVMVLDTVEYAFISTPEELQDGLYVFEINTTETLPDSGNVVIGYEGTGFARKVIASDLIENTLTLETEQATIAEIFKNGTLDLSTQDSGPNQNFGSLQNDLISSGELAVTLYESQFTQISANGQVNLDWDEILFNIQVNGLTDVTGFEFALQNASLNSNFSFELDINGSIDLPEQEFEYDNLYSTTKVILLGAPPFVIPVVVYIEVDLVAIIALSTSSELNTGYNISNSSPLDLGISWDENNGFDPTAAFTVGPTASGFIPINGSVNANLSISVGPEITAELYGVIGPRIAPLLNTSAEANASTGLNWDFGVDAAAQVRLGVSDFANAFEDYSTEFEFLETDVYDSPDSLSEASGNNQSGTANQSLEEPMQVKVLDSFNAPQSNTMVYFNVMEGGGSISQDQILSNDEGFAATVWTLGEDGDQVLEAEIRNHEGQIIGEAVIFTATLDFDCPDLEANLGDPCQNADGGDGIVDADCNCYVTPDFDCPDLEANIGDNCDDGNPSTSVSTIDSNCECSGCSINSVEIEYDYGDVDYQEEAFVHSFSVEVGGIGTYEYQWSGGESLSSDDSEYYTVLAPVEEVGVFVTDEFGCSENASYSIDCLTYEDDVFAGYNSIMGYDHFQCIFNDDYTELQVNHQIGWWDLHPGIQEELLAGIAPYEMQLELFALPEGDFSPSFCYQGFQTCGGPWFSSLTLQNTLFANSEGVFTLPGDFSDQFFDYYCCKRLVIVDSCGEIIVREWLGDL